jgi:hypothetical protein
MGAFPVGLWFKPLPGGAMERDHKQEPRVPGEPVAGMRIEMPHPCCSSPVWVPDSIGKRQSRIGRAPQATPDNGWPRVVRSLKCHIWHPKRRHRCTLKSTRAFLPHLKSYANCKRLMPGELWGCAPRGFTPVTGHTRDFLRTDTGPHRNYEILSLVVISH